MLALLFPLLSAIAPPTSAFSAGHPIDVQIVVEHGLYLVEAGTAAPEAWVQFPLPIPYRGQTPLAEVVTSEPLDKVLGFSIVADKAERLLRVHLRPLAEGEKVLLRANTFVLLRRENAPGGEGVALAGANETPADVKKYLDPAPGVDSGDARIQKIAKGFPRSDLKTIVDALFDFLTKNVKEGSGGQSAVQVLERGSADGAGSANLAAALLIAAKVPARILPCAAVGPDAAERYIVEAWTQKLGWSKIEPTTKTFPLDDSKHLILRIVEPTTPRASGSVPLYAPISNGITADFGIVPPNKGWLSAEVIETQQVPEDELEVIESAGRKAFEALIAKLNRGARGVFVPSTKAPAALKARGKKILELVEHRLDG